MRYFSKKVFMATILGLSSTFIFAAQSTPSSPAASNAPNSKAAQLVTKVLSGQATIEQSFPAIDGWTGFVVKSTQGGASGIVYADPKGGYVFIGSIINAQGQEMTQMYTNQYITSKIAGPAYHDAENTHWFADGNDNAPHKAYILIDPNCVFCHLLYKQVKPLIDSGQLQVRWIPVAFRDPTSAGKAAALLNAGSQAASDKALQQNEDGFNDQSESGALVPLKANAEDPTISAAFAKVGQNTAYFSKYGFQGTPTLLFKKNDGSIEMIPGMPRGQEFQDMISSMSSTW